MTFKEKFIQDVDKLRKRDIPDLQDRINIANELVEGYFKEYETVPPSYQLMLIGSFILDEERNTHPDKVTNTEYPILTHSQWKKRLKREWSNEFIETYTDSGQHKVSGKKKPKIFKVFGEYE